MKHTKNMVFAAMFLAIGLLIPFVTVQNPALGSMLLLMHIPVLLCGYFCGWPFGLAVGAVTPLLRSVLFGMPPMFPVAVSMAFELAVYGLLSGLFYKLFPKKPGYVYLSLLLSMIGGRIVWGIVTYALYGLQGTAFTWDLFIQGAVITALPGIALQIVVIPLLVFALNRREIFHKGHNVSA